MNKEIERPGDLAPKGIKSTIKGDLSFDEVFDHIYKLNLNPKAQSSRNNKT